jgi:hypothetical protein
MGQQFPLKLDAYEASYLSTLLRHILGGRSFEGPTVRAYVIHTNQLPQLHVRLLPCKQNMVNLVM